MAQSAMLDLTHLKWAQIRNMEGVIVTEKENFQLRQQIVELTAKYKTAMANQKNIFSTSAANTQAIMLRKTKTSMMDLKYEWHQMKRDLEDEMESAQQDVLEKSRQATTQLLMNILHRDKKIVELTNENVTLQNTVTKLSEKPTESAEELAAKQRQLQLIDDANNKLRALKEELERSEKRKNELAEENRNIKTQCDAAVRENKQWNTKNEALNLECRRLKSRLSVVEYESREAIEAAVRTEIDTREQCERILIDFESENTYLFQRIGELESELERLRALSNVPKADNNFAKFVQLKSENVALKTQINTAARKRLQQLGITNGMVKPSASSSSNNTTNQNSNSSNNNNHGSPRSLFPSSGVAIQKVRKSSPDDDNDSIISNSMLGYDYDTPHDDRSAFDPADDATVRTGHDSISNTNVRSSLSLDYRSLDSFGTKSLQFQIDDYLEKDPQPMRESGSMNVRDTISLRDLGRNQGIQGPSSVTSSSSHGMLLSIPPPSSLVTASSSSSSLHKPRQNQSLDIRNKPIDDSDDEFSPIKRSQSQNIATITNNNNNNPFNNNVNRSNSNNNHLLKNGSIVNLASNAGPLPSKSSSNQLAQQAGYIADMSYRSPILTRTIVNSPPIITFPVLSGPTTKRTSNSGSYPFKHR